MPLYTPFIERNVDKIANSIAEKRKKQLTQGAFMGDQQAIRELSGINPELAANIQNRKQKQQQQDLAIRARQQKQMESVKERMATMEFEQAAAFGAKSAQEIGIQAPPLTPELHETIKKNYGQSAFSGTSMDAQVSNLLSDGVDDPAFRNTPEYARAWQLANEPKVIRTPTGDITLRPELSSIFKAPGDTSTGKEQIDNIKETVKRDVEVIPGTEKDIKTTADEKLSFGYFNRMKQSEKNIADLGDFDSSSKWERFKGITNITASPELQQYRQAADDWIRAKLRRESGAVIANEEMDEEYKIYFPQIGDSDAVIKQKKSARQQAQKSMEVAAGREAKKRKLDRIAELEKELRL